MFLTSYQNLRFLLLFVTGMWSLMTCCDVIAGSQELGGKGGGEVVCCSRTFLSIYSFFNKPFKCTIFERSNQQNIIHYKRERECTWELKKFFLFSTADTLRHYQTIEPRNLNRIFSRNSMRYWLFFEYSACIILSKIINEENALIKEFDVNI